jgi:uncharacterized protein
MWYVAIFFVLVLAYWVLLYFMQDRLLFPIDMAPRPAKALPPRGAEIWTIDIDGGQVEAWFLPAPGASAESPAPIVVHFHGNAEVIDYQDDVIALYRRLGFSVLLPEFRGYGRSAGVPSQVGIRADAERFYERLVARPDVDRSRIVFQGRSVGCAVAADLAARHKPAAMVMVSPFLSAASMAWKFYAPPLLVKHPFHTDRVLRELDAPVLIFHGKRDDIIPFAQGQALAKVAKRSTFVAYDCAHNDFPGPGNEQDFERRIEAFLREAGVAR